MTGEKWLKVDVTEMSRNYTPPGIIDDSYITYSTIILVRRNVPLEDVRKQKTHRMPGFKFNWYYTGIDVEQLKPFYNDSQTKKYVRIFSK